MTNFQKVKIISSVLFLISLGAAILTAALEWLKENDNKNGTKLEFDYELLLIAIVFIIIYFEFFAFFNKLSGFVKRSSLIGSATRMPHIVCFNNTSFGSNDKRTDVWHRVNIRGYNDGYADVTAEKGASGEGSSLLSFKLKTY